MGSTNEKTFVVSIIVQKSYNIHNDQQVAKVKLNKFRWINGNIDKIFRINNGSVNISIHS